jgi:hypothetical protein
VGLGEVFRPLPHCFGAGPKSRKSALAFYFSLKDTGTMDSGELVYLSSRLLLGALASFFAIMLWSKTRDAAWMLMIMGTLTAYIESVYLVLTLFGIGWDKTPFIGTVSLPLILLPSLRNVFFIAAFLVMVIRKYRRAGPPRKADAQKDAVI